MDKFIKDLPENQKLRFKDLPEHEWEKQVREMMRERARKKQQEKIAEFLKSLPPDVRARIEAMPEKERQRAIRELMQQKHRPQLPGRLLDLLTPEQRKRIESMPPQERQEALKRLAQDFDMKLKPIKDRIARALAVVQQQRRRAAIDALRRAVSGKPPLAAPAGLPAGLTEADLKLLRALPPQQLNKLLNSLVRPGKAPERPLKDRPERPDRKPARSQ